ncbi:hypothetical protein MNB_SUP05-SYMBIONT-5-489 [hydrothermal vent metagenome]|uniref:Uncharacterized protein n=1 Tax=hydrothermal vent metagenome TaxID=652676 RepID=A0A1W1E5B7_9ZZZZ
MKDGILMIIHIYAKVSNNCLFLSAPKRIRIGTIFITC